MDGGKSAARLWQDYQILTSELVKFSARKDITMVNELLRQRGKVQEMLAKAEGRASLVAILCRTEQAEIQEQDALILRNLQAMQNNRRQQNVIMQAYDGSTRAGGRFNRQG